MQVFWCKMVWSWPTRSPCQLLAPCSVKALVSYFFFFFFLCVPSHARFSVRWVRRSPQSAAVSQPVPKASCGPPPDWAMSGVSSHWRWSRTAGCGWGLRTRAAWTFVWVGNFQSVEVGEELTVSSSQSKDCDLSCSVQLVDAVLLCPNV